MYPQKLGYYYFRRYLWEDLRRGFGDHVYRVTIETPRTDREIAYSFDVNFNAAEILSAVPRWPVGSLREAKLLEGQFQTTPEEPSRFPQEVREIIAFEIIFERYHQFNKVKRRALLKSLSGFLKNEDDRDLWPRAVELLRPISHPYAINILKKAKREGRIAGEPTASSPVGDDLPGIEVESVILRLEQLRIVLTELEDHALAAKTEYFRNQLSNGARWQDLAIEALAVFREMARRQLKQEATKEQLQTAVHLLWHAPAAAEQACGEGKTLSIALVAYVAALQGRVVHIHTFTLLV
jgi:hypothetical protein